MVRTGTEAQKLLRQETVYAGNVCKESIEADEISKFTATEDNNEGRPGEGEFTAYIEGDTKAKNGAD